MTCPERLRSLRVRNKLTQASVASRIGIPQRTYSYYESGDRRIPLDHLAALARFYDCSLDYISGASHVPRPYPEI
jgi:transcriptional regulator with XRE-family HTH domain